MRFELIFLVWKTKALPLNYIRTKGFNILSYLAPPLISYSKYGGPFL